MKRTSYRLRIDELNTLKAQKSSPLGRGFPGRTMIMKDDNITSFYTCLPNFVILLSIFSFVTKSIYILRASYQCFFLTVMKLRLNLTNYDLGFRFCVHETTVSRVLVKWLQFMDIRLSPLIQWPERAQLQKTMPSCFREHFGLRVTSMHHCH